MAEHITFNSGQWWNRSSIRAKLQLSIVGYALLVLIISSATLAIMANKYFHEQMKQDLQMLGSVLAENSRAAITFNDVDSAWKILAALKANESVVSAGLFRTKDNSFFVGYPNADIAAALGTKSENSGVWLDGDAYFTSVPVTVDGDIVAQLVIQSNLVELSQFKGNLVNLFFILVASLVFLTLLITLWLKKNFTEPLSSLSHWALRVTDEKDFSAQAEKINNDEIGYLADSLNQMMRELSKQETIISLNKVLEREIQERMLVEKDLIEMRNRAEEANKAKSRFLANMSHELRTPLNAIIGYSEMLQEIVSEDDYEEQEIVDDLGKVRSAGKHLLSLINDILDISKIEAGKMQISIEAFVMNDLVQEVVDTLKPLANERGNKLVVRSDRNNGIVHSDLVKVRQILFNLLSNAVKFTQNGLIELTTERLTQADRNWIECKVRDSGIGINESSLKELFKPFNQADPSTTRKYGGTGLGLAISQSYVNMLGGNISVTSELGKGTEFTIRLPITVTEENEGYIQLERHIQQIGLGKRLSEDVSSESRYKNAPLSILLIDDDEGVHDIFRHQLSKGDFKLSSAYSGAEGFELINKNSFDIIILDIFMPEMDGWQVLKKLKTSEATDQIPVVLYTISSEREKGYALGASEYLIKPIDRQRLIQVLQRYRNNRHLKVLSIDDDEHCQKLIQAYLKEPGWSVTVARNGVEALRILASDTDFSVILLDLLMPEMNGFELLDICRQRPETSNIPIVVISARDLTESERELLLTHAQAVMRKGMYDKATLVSCIKNILHEQLRTVQTKE